MTIYRQKGQQQGAGFVSGPSAWRFRGNWTPATKYARGEVAVDPSGVLRWCTVTHTSPGTFSAGTEYSSTVQWMPLPTNGTFRGPYVQGSQYRPNELVVNPSGQLVRALYSNSGGNGTDPYDPTLFADLGAVPAFANFQADVILPPVGMPGTDIAGVGHGLWPVRSRLRYPRAEPIALFHASADFTSLSGAGAGLISADPDPLTPQGSPQLRFSTVATKTLSAPVDLSAAIVRFPVKIPGSGATRTGVSNSYFQVSSDGFASGNYSQILFVGTNDLSHLGDNVWCWAGGSLDDWQAVGAGADLTAINAIRFNLAGSTSQVCSLSHVSVIPNATKAKCCLWFDDCYVNDWTSGLALMAGYGFPGNLAAAGAIDGQNASMLSSTMLRYLTEFYGWHTAIHYYFASDGVDPQCMGGLPMEAWMMESRHMLAAIGCTGMDDMAWHSQTHLTAANVQIVRRYCRTGRKYNQAGTRIETLPPIDPYLMRARGSATADVTDSGAALIAMIDRAITAKGLIQIAWENFNLAGHPEFANVLAHLDANRSSIDVVTLAEALSPWAVTS